MALGLITSDDIFRSSIYRVRGLVKREMGLLHDALVDFNEALCVNPGVATVYHSRGLVNREMGRMDDAITDLSKAIDLSSDPLNYIYHKKRIIENNLEELEDQVENMVSVLCNLYIARASMMHESGCIEDAEKDLEMAEQLARRTDDPKRRIDDIRKKRRSF